jgi:thioredoxin 1
MPETELITVTDANFAETVLAAELPFVVDFWAEWCPPCRPMARALAELAPEFAGRLRIGKLNADENPEAARAYRVLSMPTLLFFTGGTVTASLVGARPKSILRATLANALTPYVNS